MHWHITGSFTQLIDERIFFFTKDNACLLVIASGSKRLGAIGDLVFNL